MEVQGDYLAKPRCRACNVCASIESMLMTHAGGHSYEDQRAYKMALDLYIRHDPETHETKPPRTTHEGNGKPQGWFAGTLTKSPDWEETEADMITAIRKIMSQKTVPVDKYAWYLEYTENGQPHIHFLYISDTGGRIHAKIFKRYWKHWDEHVKVGKGHRGGFHKPVNSLMAYSEYISKDSGTHDTNMTPEDLKE